MQIIFTLILLALVFWVINRPSSLLRRPFSPKPKSYSIDQEYNYRKSQEQASVDTILEKIHRKGIKSLSKTEKELLDRYSKMQR